MKKIILIACLSLLSACSLFTQQSADFKISDSDKTVGSIEIFDAKALTLLDPRSKISIRGEGFTWVEGPVWIEQGQYLLFSDIPLNIIRKFDVSTGNSIYLQNSGYNDANKSHLPHGANGLLVDHQGQLVLMQSGDRQIARMTAPLAMPQANYQVLTNNYLGKQFNSTNDGVFHQDGSLYFTDPTYGLAQVFDSAGQLITRNKNKSLDEPRAQQIPFSGLYRLATNGEVTLLDDSLTFPNGVALSPDQKTLYVAVSDKNYPVWFAYDVLADGKLANKREFYRVKMPTQTPSKNDKSIFSAAHIVKKDDKGLPDGMVVHSSGAIFATGPGGVWVFDSAGKVLAKIRTGQSTSNCTLTTDEKYLFITADDYLMSVPLR